MKKKVLYYVIMLAIFIVLDLVVCFGYAITNLKPGMFFTAFLIMALVLTGAASPYIKKWLGIEEKEEQKKEEKN